MYRSARTVERVGVAICVACTAFVASASASALELAWDAPEGCPSQASVLARVEQIAGASAAGTAVRAAGSIARLETGVLRLQLVVRSGDLLSERTIDGKSCADLGGAAAIAVALVLTSEAPPAPEPAPTPTPPRAPTPAPAPASASAPAPPPRTVHGLLQLPRATLGIGPLPGDAVGLGVGAGVSVANFRLLAEGERWATSNTSATYLADEYTARIERFGVNLRACRAWVETQLELAPCAVLGLRHLAASGSGPHIAPQTDRATWLALGAGLRARWQLAPWLGVVLGADAELELSRPEIRIAGVGIVRQLAPAAFTGTVGFEWIL
jgi:hypothetical protein